MRETLKNMRLVYGYGKKYKINLIIFTIISISNIAINIAYPIFTAKVLVSLTSGLYEQVLIAALICFGMSFLCDFTTVALRKNTQVFFRGTTKNIQIAAAREILKIELTSIDKTGSGALMEEVRGFNLSCNRVFALFGDSEFGKETFGTKHIDKINGNFEFKNVYFSYGNNPVLKNMSFKVKTNQTVAFVGKSGVGKTTIFSLLCKLYNVDSGNILIDGININELDEESIRNNITIISQSPYIFNLSIKDNFKLVKKNVTDEEMIEACKLAYLDDFIQTLPDKYDTIVGEGGVTLSGGQRQKLAIARAFVQNTKIILFDEATSALDNETQAYIQKAINNMKDKYTILIIAHRLSTVINADRIMIVDDGKIVDTGTHNQLLKSNKLYKKLYENEIVDE